MIDNYLVKKSYDYESESPNNLMPVWIIPKLKETNNKRKNIYVDFLLLMKFYDLGQKGSLVDLDSW